MTEDKSPEASELGMDVICQFAGHLAHEMNNLLTPIIACGQMLKDGMSESDPQYFCAEQVYEAGERCMAFSRKLQIIGSRRSNAQEIELASMVQEVVKTVSLPEDKNVRIDVSESELPSEGGQELLVSIDSEQLAFLVTELVQNAAQFMPNGGTVTVNVTERDGVKDHEGDEWVCLSVRDEGTGMDEETISKIYEPYFSTISKARERGLGLTLVYGIVRRAGGVIECESSPGQGTTFRVSFPRVKAAVAE